MTWGLSCWTRFEIIRRRRPSATVDDGIVDPHGAECAGAASHDYGIGICERVVLAKRGDGLVTVFSTAATPAIRSAARASHRQQTPRVQAAEISLPFC
jgi:hypothetical protein